MRIVGKAGNITQALTFLAASGSRESLFRPLKVLARDGRFYTCSGAEGGIAFVVGSVKFGEQQGEGYLTIDPDLFLRRLGLYAADEEIIIDTQPDKYTIKGLDTRIIYYPIAESECRYYDEVPFVVKDGILHYKKGAVPPTTKVFIDASELQKLPPRLSMLSIPTLNYYQFHFSEDGKSRALVGNFTDRDHTPIDTELACRVEGEDLDIVLSAGFREIVKTLEGRWTLSSRKDSLVWLYRACEQYRLGYQIAPRVGGR